MRFGSILEHMRAGGLAHRTGWNGKGMYVGLRGPEGVITRDYLVMKTADDKLVPWVPSQTCILADDWQAYWPDEGK